MNNVWNNIKTLFIIIKIACHISGFIFNLRDAIDTLLPVPHVRVQVPHTRSQGTAWRNKTLLAHDRDRVHVLVCIVVMALNGKKSYYVIVTVRHENGKQVSAQSPVIEKSTILRFKPFNRTEMK